ncbi:hypothetical protein [Mixta calida]|uniref:hypothetical protein n=1 Tax=Mixta calida TaxID=665913 RepID=UPI00403AE1E5
MLRKRTPLLFLIVVNRLPGVSRRVPDAHDIFITKAQLLSFVNHNKHRTELSYPAINAGYIALRQIVPFDALLLFNRAVSPYALLTTCLVK